MDQEKRLSTLVFEASNLRDYLMHVQGEDSGELAHALRPFDRVDDLSAVPDDDVLTMRNAFQSAHDRLCLRIDTYTIGEVLKGKSPVGRGPPIVNSLLLCLAGVALVVSVFNFTYWSNQAGAALAEAEEFLAFDHSSEIAHLVELKTYFDTVVPDGTSDSLEPQLMYLEGISTLQTHYSREQALMGSIMGLWTEARAYNAPGKNVTRWICDKSPDRALGRVAIGYAMAFTCPQVIEDPPVQTIQPLPPAVDGMVDPKKAESIFDQNVVAVQTAQLETMKAANRAAISYYQDTLLAVRNAMKDLRAARSTVHLWVLPILYGMLGSVVYCMWRVLNPSVAPLGFFYSVMRTIFAGLAAMTLSMLLVPSNILSAGVELNRPLIYLLSFVFGYSVEVFINTLNMFNAYFLANLTTRQQKNVK